MSDAASTASEFQYAGTELGLFAKAQNWKTYWRQEMAAFVRGDVLEVGAGLGANTRLLEGLDYRSWTALEPDPKLAAQIEPVAGRRVVVGTLQDQLAKDRFDAVLYLDVLEHIEDDGDEMRRAHSRLNPGGALVVLAPAHPFLYTPFDAAIGHFRRYTRASLERAMPPDLIRSKLVYLDAAGLLASAANRLWLKSSMPTEAQIRTWDRRLVPLSRRIDPLLGWRAGKSVLGVWRRHE